MKKGQTYTQPIPIRMMTAVFVFFFMFNWLTTQAGSRANVKSLITANPLYRYTSQMTIWTSMHVPVWLSLSQ
jgi:hypothetical protein